MRPHNAAVTDLQAVTPGIAAVPREEDLAESWCGQGVPAGRHVRTGYVPIHEVVVYAYSQLLPAEVERAYRRQLELGPDQSWPPPTGYSRDDRFVLTDGRNRFIAALMLGYEFLFVAWLDNGDD
jgi:hypothetical protein